MRVGGGAYALAAERTFSAESLLRLGKHELFDFQIQTKTVSVRVAELRELLERGQDEHDLADLLDEFVHELEDLIHTDGGQEVYLLAALQHFRQQMEMFLEIDQDALVSSQGSASVGMTNLFAHSKSKSPVRASPSRPGRSSPASARKAASQLQGRIKQQQQQQRAHQRRGHGHGQASEDDVVCGVCFQADSLEHDPIVICDLCSAAVHQSCYRIPDVPDDDWFCHPCQRYLRARDIDNNVTPTYELECAACHLKGGAFIATIDDKWVHMACSMFLPELYVQPSPRHPGEEVIGGVDQLRARRQLRCCYCKKKERGACAQCVVGKCTTSYHVLCALRHDLKFVFMEDKDQFGSGCSRHQKQFLGGENVHTTDEEPAGSSKARPTSTRPVPARSPLKKKLKTKSKRRDSDSSESSEDDDGVVLDQESDDSRVLDSDSDVELQMSKPNRKSPVRSTYKPPADSSLPSKRSSPGRQTSPRTRARPKKQQTLNVPAFGIVKDIQKPLLPQPQAKSTTAAPSSLLVRLPPPPPPNLAKAHMKAQVLIPLSGPTTTNGVFEDVVLVVPSLPLGISVRTEKRSHGMAMFIQAPASTNPILTDAVRRKVLQDGDEVLAINDVSMRNREVLSLKELLKTLQPPYRCWIRTGEKKNLAFFVAPTQGSQTTIQVDPPTAEPRSGALTSIQPMPVTTTDVAFTTPNSKKKDSPADQMEKKSPLDEALSVDWPWFYLRSDGKLAMNLMWKSLEAGFFVQKFDKSTWSKFLGQVEALIGFKLSAAHPDYAKRDELLLVPDREFPVPDYLLEFRRSQLKKKRSLANDSVFYGVNMEEVKNDDEWDNLPPLEVGSTVQVAKRTWPGINKLGGAGRVKKVHEEMSADGEKKRYLYDITYILGGSEKKVERKWIAMVHDLHNQSKPTATDEAESSNSGADFSACAEEEEVRMQLRLGFRLQVTDFEVKLPAQRRSPDGKVHLQISIHTNSVPLVRSPDEDGEPASGAAKREILWHQHFPVRQQDTEMLISEAVSGALEYVEERCDDDVDSDDEERSEVLQQLETAQLQFQYVMARNDELFAALQTAAEQEYAARGYRKRAIDEIQWKHYDDMYREIVEANEKFEDSDDSDNGVEGAERSGHADKDGRQQRQRAASSSDSESDQDESCGGMFVNKIKQEGNEVCVLCELTGGDFAATSCGRFVHPQCAMYTPETFFKDGIAHGIDKIPADERRALSCSTCGNKRGLSKVQCGNQRCTIAYHVACAYVNGLLTKDPHYQAWCPKHLKSSGMAGEIEWPRHMRPNKADHRKDAHTPDKGPSRGASRGAISSSTSARKRKQRREHGDVGGKTKRNPVASLVPDEPTEQSCARRLVIDEESDDAAATEFPLEPLPVLHKGDTVEVQSREWPGVNKPGGVARITNVNDASSNGERGITYDVAYVLTNTKEKHVEAQYVRLYAVNQGEADDGKSANRHNKKRRVGSSVM